MRRTAADRAYVVLVRVNYLMGRFTTLNRRQHRYARIWFCCVALSRLQTLLLLSERNLNRVDRIEPTRLRPLSVTQTAQCNGIGVVFWSSLSNGKICSHDSMLRLSH